jgi:hypothetical protein
MEQVERQVLQVGDEVAVAAEQLIVSLAFVLGAAPIRGDDVIVGARQPIERDLTTELIEAGACRCAGMS